MNKIKKFYYDHQTGITVAILTVTSTVLGTVAINQATRVQDLEKQLKEKGKPFVFTDEFIDGLQRIHAEENV